MLCPPGSGLRSRYLLHRAVAGSVVSVDDGRAVVIHYLDEAAQVIPGVLGRASQGGNG